MNTNSVAHEAKLSEGWVLYYSEDGYPYYYHPETQESEWAPYDEYTSAETAANVDPYDEGNWKTVQEEYIEQPGDGEEVKDSEQSQNSEEDGFEDEEEVEEEEEEEEEDDSEDSGQGEDDDDDDDDDNDDDETNAEDIDLEAFDKETEDKFKAYLRTPAGQAAAEVMRYLFDLLCNDLLILPTATNHHHSHFQFHDHRIHCYPSLRYKPL